VASKKKTWREKLHIDRKPEIGDIVRPPHLKQYGAGKMLIPTPLQVDAIIREIPVGEIKKLKDLGDDLARRSGADMSCPMCMGIFWRIAAGAAEEDRLEGRKDLTPYWRVIKSDGKLNEKLPGGIEAHRAMLDAEGHQADGAKLVV
jgi:hypothetical protein